MIRCPLTSKDVFNKTCLENRLAFSMSGGAHFEPCGACQVDITPRTEDLIPKRRGREASSLIANGGPQRGAGTAGPTPPPSPLPVLPSREAPPLAIETDPGTEPKPPDLFWPSGYKKRIVKDHPCPNCGFVHHATSKRCSLCKKFEHDQEMMAIIAKLRSEGKIHRGRNRFGQILDQQRQSMEGLR